MIETEILPRVAPEEVGLSAPALDRLTQVFQSEVERNRLPGAVAVIARRGKIAYFESVGFRDKSLGAPMGLGSIFRIYSMTKCVTSVAAMMLWEEGHFTLLDPIGRYIPELAKLTVAGNPPIPAVADVTIQDVLRHTAGFHYGTTGDPLLDEPYNATGAQGLDHTNAELMGKLSRAPLAHHPGAGWEYGRSTEVLGRLVEVISGQTLDRFFQERILGPLGMVDTGFAVTEPNHKRIAEPFPNDPDTGEEIRLIDIRRMPKLLMGGAGLASTAIDYARFAQMLLNGGSLGETRILSPRTVAYMASDHLGPITAPRYMPGPGYGFGLGFFVRLNMGVAPHPGSIGDFGWNGVAGTSFWVDPQEEMIAVLLTQVWTQRRFYRALFRNLVYAAL